jgi:hypothetical protein
LGPTLPPFLGYPEDTTCGDLQKFGLDGQFSPRGCGILQSQTQILEECGCTTVI